jgi:hypothetical protein
MGNLGVLPIATFNNLTIRFTPMGQGPSRCPMRIFLDHQQIWVRVITECRRTLESRWLVLLESLGWSLKVGPEHTTNHTLNFFDMVPYPRGFRVPDFVKFAGEDSKTTYEHVGQFLAQASDFGITDVHRIRLFPLSLSWTTFNWFISLAPNSVNTWESLKQKLHEYFYNGETELRLSHLVGIKQKQGESVADYVRRFRDT